VTPSSILFTTLDNLLHCIPVESFLSTTLLTKLGKGRSIERGALLVGHEEGGTLVCMQMPRGNLESFHPRELLLRRIKCLLDQLKVTGLLGIFLSYTMCNCIKFGEVMEEMRRHRINTNLLYDHDSKIFIANIGIFVAQIDVESLNLFLTTLSDDDSTKGSFSSPLYFIALSRKCTLGCSLSFTPSGLMDSFDQL